MQALQLCQKAGLVKLGQVAIDGTKLQANASKHKAMSYGRMTEAEEKLKAEIENFSNGPKPWMPPRMRRRGKGNPMSYRRNWRGGKAG
jgi:hypothetical protein